MTRGFAEPNAEAVHSRGLQLNLGMEKKCQDMAACAFW
jgi:hypothetical protein